MRAPVSRAEDLGSAESRDLRRARDQHAADGDQQGSDDACDADAFVQPKGTRKHRQNEADPDEGIGQRQRGTAENEKPEQRSDAVEGEAQQDHRGLREAANLSADARRSATGGGGRPDLEGELRKGGEAYACEDQKEQAHCHGQSFGLSAVCH